MLFTQSYVGNSVVARNQLANRDLLRNIAQDTERAYAQMHAASFRRMGFKTNSGLIPRDVYQEFDNVTVIRLRSDDGDTFLNDLLPLSRAVNIGKQTFVTRRASDSGIVQTSMTGQLGIKMDQVEHDYDGTIIPVHDAGFYRNWREWNAQQSEGFDALVDDMRETVAAVRRRLADSFMDGHNDSEGNLIVVDARSWAGMRNDSRVQSVDLGAGGVNFDFTDDTKTGDENKNALITVMDFLYITNNCEKDVTLYISREITRNWERNFATNYDGKLIIDQLSKITGIADIKTTNKLTGNQLMAFPLDEMGVIPVVGMGMSTMALPRPLYNSNYEFVTATAVGWFVKTDFFDKTCALYAEA